MPKSNIRGGKGHKKFKKRRNTQDGDKGKINYADEGQVYGLVKKRVGGKRLQVECSDGKERSAIIPGNMRKRVWMNPNDVVLCDLESIGVDDVCSICQKYTPKEISILKREGKIEFDVADQSDNQDAYKFEDQDNYDDLMPVQNTDRLDANISSDESDSEDIQFLNKKQIKKQTKTDDSSSNDSDEHDIDNL